MRRGHVPAVGWTGRHGGVLDRSQADRSGGLRVRHLDGADDRRTCHLPPVGDAAPVRRAGGAGGPPGPGTGPGSSDVAGGDGRPGAACARDEPRAAGPGRAAPGGRRGAARNGRSRSRAPWPCRSSPRWGTPGLRGGARSLRRPRHPRRGRRGHRRGRVRLCRDPGVENLQGRGLDAGHDRVLRQ